jgi:hypothetical protein
MIELAQFVSMCSKKKSEYLHYIHISAEFVSMCSSFYIYIYVMTLMFSAGISQRDSFRAAALIIIGISGSNTWSYFNYPGWW